MVRSGGVSGSDGPSWGYKYKQCGGEPGILANIYFGNTVIGNLSHLTFTIC